MIEIGLCGWGDHSELYREAGASRNKLPVYAHWFRVVEVDSTFYAIQAPQVMEKWASDTPEGFRFVIKAYQGMTGHARGGKGGHPFDGEEAMFRAFLDAIAPIRAAGKLMAVLFQYPPWFNCTRQNVDVLRSAKARMGDVPCGLEFRHQSWFAGEMREKTLAFERREGWIHTVCDEPQVGDGCIPIVEAAADDALTIVRFHGRNANGWVSAGQPNWRDVRYLYRYDERELAEWAERLRRLERLSDEVCVLFNNNSGGDAADNALQLMAMLGQLPPRGSYELAPPKEEPEQLKLFELD
ncbi:DUF72 domain-containing protein [Paenibacillus sacheonensis]|uniref:DUF72 domain-containing protein n=1 Tax=Paenibacillus sacheonensis TaxID=742054 RepID=A0A7X5C1U7_9BACL|nr:DUF72 domain-containing protein [Paenibacillus sacheonensis]MBM7566566.1 uncharacterized protein YecE (DUF72 family) [Paenibacillus sacheonensis]NBC73066.1 DUF72 domain-containing protein [Paenibacillus sacheonensis]